MTLVIVGQRFRGEDGKGRQGFSSVCVGARTSVLCVLLYTEFVLFCFSFCEEVSLQII